MMFCASISVIRSTSTRCWVIISSRASSLISTSCSAGVKPVGGGRGVARMGQFTQARDAHGVELIEVVGRDRQKAQPFQQRHARVLRFFHNPPVEAQPAELTVVEPARAADIQIGQFVAGGNGALRKSAWVMTSLMALNCNELRPLVAGTVSRARGRFVQHLRGKWRVTGRFSARLARPAVHEVDRGGKGAVHAANR